MLGEYLDLFVEFVPLLDRLSIPYVTQGHGIDLSASLRDADIASSYQAYHSARAVLTRCEFHRRRLIELGLPAGKVHVNPGGVDLPETAPARAPEAGKRLLAIGRMTAKKGPIYTLEAFRRAAGRDAIRCCTSTTTSAAANWRIAVAQFVTACDLEGRAPTLHGPASAKRPKARLLEASAASSSSTRPLPGPATGDEEGLPRPASRRRWRTPCR